MQHQEKYTLTWQSYSDHLSEALGEMMTSSEFADVTLVTDDKQQIRAHRNILSAASPVFKNMLQLDSKNIDPVIYLRGIQHSEIESIMQFIYLGEARFYEERMSEFLMVSKNLEIKGLSTGIEKNDQTTSNEESSDHENGFAEDDTYEQPTQNFSEDVTCSEPQAHSAAEPITINNTGKRKVCQTDGAKYACNQCDYQATRQDYLTTHIQSLHEGVKYACNQCDKQYSAQQSLTQHKQSKHEGIKYACKQCDQQFTRQIRLTQHIKSAHEQ